jgi:hypothetical protein
VPEASIEQVPPAVVGAQATPNEIPADSESICVESENTRVNLARIAWLVTTLSCFAAAVFALAEGYRGYAAVAFAVAVSAGINLL